MNSYETDKYLAYLTRQIAINSFMLTTMVGIFFSALFGYIAFLIWGPV